jgi:hypothetical protein
VLSTSRSLTIKVAFTLGTRLKIEVISLGIILQPNSFIINMEAYLYGRRIYDDLFGLERFA